MRDRVFLLIQRRRGKGRERHGKATGRIRNHKISCDLPEFTCCSSFCSGQSWLPATSCYTLLTPGIVCRELELCLHFWYSAPQSCLGVRLRSVRTPYTRISQRSSTKQGSNAFKFYQYFCPGVRINNPTPSSSTSTSTRVQYMCSGI